LGSQFWYDPRATSVKGFHNMTIDTNQGSWTLGQGYRRLALPLTIRAVFAAALWFGVCYWFALNHDAIGGNEANRIVLRILPGAAILGSVTAAGLWFGLSDRTGLVGPFLAVPIGLAASAVIAVGYVVAVHQADPPRTR
jgi:hypothetical protein